MAKILSSLSLFITTFAMLTFRSFAKSEGASNTIMTPRGIAVPALLLRASIPSSLLTDVHQRLFDVTGDQTVLYGPDNWQLRLLDFDTASVVGAAEINYLRRALQGKSTSEIQVETLVARRSVRGYTAVYSSSTLIYLYGNKMSLHPLHYTLFPNIFINHYKPQGSADN